MSVSYIMDPYDPLLKNIVHKADQLLEKEKGLITTTILEKGLVSHDIITDNPIKIVDIINQANYIPVTVTLNKFKLNKILSESDNVLGTYLEGIKEIIIVLTNLLLSSPVESVEILEREHTYVFNPITELGTSVFSNPQYLNHYLTLCNPDNFIGYQILNTSNLTRYVLEKWYDSGDYVPQDINVKYITFKENTISLIPLGGNTYLQDDYNKIKNRLDGYILSLEREGHFGYRFGIHDLETIELVKELCLMWNIKIVDDDDLSTLILQTDIDFRLTPDAWLRQNVELIKVGQLPTYTLTGKWQHLYFADYQRRYGQVYKDIILKYVAYIAYADLSENNSLITPFTYLIKINQDLSITISIPTIQLAQELKIRIETLLKEGISGVENERGAAWMIEPCKNLKDGIIKRWMVQSIDNNAYPMIIRNVSNDEILIFRSRLAIQYPSPFKFSDTEKAEKELLENMRHYYSKNNICHDNLEPVLLETISKMSLEKLLKLIPINEAGLTYCFSIDTLTKLEKLENPLTRQHFSDKTLMKMRFLEQGWRGLYDIGPLYGLYEDVPVKINIPTTVGIADIRMINTTAKERDLTGNLFLVEVLFKDSTIEPLFEISLPKVGLDLIDDLEKYVIKLWEVGYFLNYWTSAVQKYIVPEKTQSYSVLVISDILRNAGDSIFDGNKALEMLRRVYLKESL